MLNFRVFGFVVLLLQLIQINGLETRPNSLAGSLVKVSTAIEWNVCKRVVNLGQESSVDLLSVSLALDSLLATANHELEDLYVKIGQVLEQIVKDKKLSKEWRRLNLDALQALISVANGLDDRLASELDGLDASESSIIDQQIGSLIAVNGLDCECACPIPKRSISVVEQTAKELKNCVAEEEDSIKWALENACKNLQDIVNKTVRKSGTRVSDTEIDLSVNITNACRKFEVCVSNVLDKAVPVAADILKDARHCLKENS